jgi:hypothetical protein
MAREIPPVLQPLVGLATRIVKNALDGAVEEALDEVQGTLTKATRHIAGARGKAAQRRRERSGEEPTKNRPEIEVTVVESAPPRRRKRD